MRLDVYLVNNKYCESRNKASSLISSGNVFVNACVVSKPSYDVKSCDVITINPEIKQYVARSAKKLLTATERFSLDFSGKIAVDLGASTGGFCQIMLENGVKKVYAVDIGSNQLHPDIQADRRVISMENTNARYIDASLFEEKIDIITCDLSFISLKLILPAVYKTLRPLGEFICLVKPQFEVGHSNVGKNGIVRDSKLHVKAVCDISDYAFSLGFYVKDICFSELAGESGNKEYLLYMLKNKSKSALSHEFIESRIREVK